MNSSDKQYNSIRRKIIKNLEYSLDHYIIKVKLLKASYYSFCPFCRSVYGKDFCEENHMKERHSFLINNEEMRRKWARALLSNPNGWYSLATDCCKMKANDRKWKWRGTFTFDELPTPYLTSTDKYNLNSMTIASNCKIQNNCEELNTALTDAIIKYQPPKQMKEEPSKNNFIKMDCDVTNKMDCDVTNKKQELQSCQSDSIVSEEFILTNILDMLKNINVTVNNGVATISQQDSTPLNINSTIQQSSRLTNGNNNSKEASQLKNVQSAIESLRTNTSSDAHIHEICEADRLADFEYGMKTAKQLCQGVYRIQSTANELFNKANGDPKVIKSLVESIVSNIILSIDLSKTQCDILNIIINFIIEIDRLCHNNISKLHLSYNAVHSHIPSISSLANELLKKNLDKSECYSLVFDETEKGSIKRIGIYTRVSNYDLTNVQSKVALVTYDEDCSGEALFEWTKEMLIKKGFDLNKMVGITTDGAANLRGCVKGMTTRFVNYIQSQRTSRSWVSYVSKFYCMAHRLNLCVKEFCNEKNTETFLFINWFNSNSTRDLWKSVVKNKHFTKPPKTSIIRWGYEADLVTYIVKYFEDIVDFMKELDKNKKLPDSMKSIGVESKEFICELLFIQEILTRSRFISDNIQSFRGMISKQYSLIKNHIQKMFSIFKELNNPFGDHVVLLEFFKAVTKLECKPMYDVLSNCYSLLEKYTNELIKKYIVLEGGDYDIDYTQIGSLEDFERESDKANIKSTLYHLVLVEMSFKNNTFTIPDNLDGELKNQLLQLQTDIATMNTQHQFKTLEEVITFVGADKYKLLYMNLIAIHCIVPTSCAVESLFSKEKRMAHYNISDTTLDTKVLCNLLIRTNEPEPFAFTGN